MIFLSTEIPFVVNIPKLIFKTLMIADQLIEVRVILRFFLKLVRAFYVHLLDLKMNILITYMRSRIQNKGYSVAGLNLKNYQFLIRNAANKIDLFKT